MVTPTTDPFIVYHARRGTTTAVVFQATADLSRPLPVDVLKPYEQVDPGRLGNVDLIILDLSGCVRITKKPTEQVLSILEQLARVGKQPARVVFVATAELVCERLSRTDPFRKHRLFTTVGEVLTAGRR